MKCPGQDTRTWTGEASFEVPCPRCGKNEEFFKDEPSRRCRACGHRILNSHMDFGCATYCTYARQCLGDLPPELVARRKELLKDRVAIKMKATFGQDFKRIGHAAQVARYAEEIARSEGSDLAVVLIAAYLHDIGFKEAEQTGQATVAAEIHEKLGPAAARELLGASGADAGLIEEVCDIISRHHHPAEQETLNFKTVYDADLVANLEESVSTSPVPEDQLAEIISSGMLTKTGRILAKRVLAESTSDAGS